VSTVFSPRRQIQFVIDHHHVDDILMRIFPAEDGDDFPKNLYYAVHDAKHEDTRHLHLRGWIYP